VNLQPITDPADPRLIFYRGLKDSVLRLKAELKGGYFVIEGRLALEAALRSPYPVLSVLSLRQRLDVLAGMPLRPGTPVYVAEREVMAAVAGFDVHRGLLALGRRLPLPQPASLLGSSRLVVVVEDVSDQENLGAIFRNAAAFGVGAVLLGPTSSDPLYRRSIRVSVGHCLRLPFSRLEPWPEALELLTNEGYALVALTPAPAAEPVGLAARTLEGHKVALVVGAEGPGLSAQVLERCRQVRVPIVPGVDSLNVATALAVALHCFAGLA
jgi:tRNA G18 (ribose-2'-O)-methylase SpoU